VRDPRDILTSLYYSMRVSHEPPGEGEHRQSFLRQRAQAEEASIDDFVGSRFLSLEILLDRYVLGLRGMDVRTYRYEDVVHRKRDWLRDIAGFLEIDVAETALAAITARHDMWPADERPDQHIRQVRPGDHRRKLQPETIEYLNQNLSDQWRMFGYPAGEPRDELALPENIFRGMPDPYAGKSVDISVVDADRLAQVQARCLPRAAQCKIYPPDGVEILGLWLEDCDGHPAADLKPGRPCTVAFILHLQEDVDELVVHMQAADRKLNPVIALNTSMLGLPACGWPAHTYLEVRFELPAPQRSGDYWFGGGCSRLTAAPETFLARHVDGYLAAVRP
jgi:hypothetical protein